MNKELVLEKTREFVRSKLDSDSSGHDWWHVYRVVQNALNISHFEDVDIFVVELASLLHDISDYKLNGGNINLGADIARDWLEKQDVPSDIINHVVEIIIDMSFKGANVNLPKMKTKEGMVVQDADRLDAMGAIGIARVFAYGGYKGRKMYNPEIKPVLHKSFDAYKNNKSPSVNHFYEKLLLLRNLMNTEKAKQIAEKRHTYMEGFLNEFFLEWDGND